MILDLRDKISLSATNEIPAALSKGNASVPAGFDSERRDAVEALTALGYSASEAASAVSKVEMSEQMTADAILKAALKYLF